MKYVVGSGRLVCPKVLVFQQMDLPVCLSQHFVNKLNVRSYKNILRAKLLKSEDIAPFLGQIFEDDLMVSRISSEFIEVLLNLRINIKNASKDDFRNYYVPIKREKGRKLLHSVNKEDILNCCWKALNQIIPRNFYGGNQNCKIVKKILQAAVFSMKRQHTTFIKLLKKWDFNVAPWNSLREESMKILCKILMWIVQYLISAMICLNFYVTTCKLDADENKLHFFWKSDWQSFYDKKVSSMIISKVLKKHNSYCLGKKLKKHHSLSERLKLKSIKREIPKLYLVLKAKNDFRPIVRYKSEQQTSAEKYKIKERLNFLKTLTGKLYQKIETQFNNIHKAWINANKPKLYFVKTDLSNAFGLINKEKLMKILYQRHLDFQKRETNVNLKKKFAQQYREIVAELRKPLLVRAGSTVYEWTEGLVQGYKFSPALSELYYSYLDELYFPEHLKKSELGIRLFMRVVDDYLYITDSLEDAYSFLDALSSYRNVNYDKTVVNFHHESIKSSKEIIFLGYSYDTETLEVSRAKNVYVGQMCYKIAFSSSISNMSKFIENRIGQSGIQINGHIFNFYHNRESIIWKHIFTTYCVSANKLCTILVVCDLCSDKFEMQMYVSLYKKRVAVKLTNSIIQTLMKNKPADFIFAYCINHFRYLSFKALYLCAKETPKCSGLIPFINAELSKSNCVFGKWQDHGCRIENNGEIGRPAIREVCRRSDLRSIMNEFHSLPSGFVCFNSRHL